MAIQKYGNQPRLLNNQRYTLVLKAKGVTHQTTFTSRYSPLYSTSRILRNDLAEMFEKVSDDVLNFTIWQTSLLADEIASEENFTDGKPNFAVKQYVRYKSVYDLLRRILLHLSSSAGSINKILGEFTISKSIKAPYVKDLLSTIDAEVKKWESAITTPLQNRGAVRAGTNFPYPINPRADF